jgi:hypothetical protein
MSNGAAAGATHYAAIAEAIKASGAIVRVEPEEFNKILAKTESPLVVVSKGGFLKSSYQYLTGYKGFIFFTKSKTPLSLSSNIEIVSAKNIWIPA